jgi:elongation factor G
MSYTTTEIRNVALVGEAGAGKTTLFEALLHAGGAIDSAGSIERGTTVSDFDPMEKERGYSIDSSIASTDHAPAGEQRIHVNLIDTPGHDDFRGQTLSALAAVETVAVVVDGPAVATYGIGHSARRLMEFATARRLCRVIVVNKTDQLGDPGATLDALRAEFGSEVLPLNLPAGGSSAVVSCFTGHDGDSDVGPVAEWHQRIIDQVVEINETVMDHYLDLGEEGLQPDELHDAFEQCLREGHLIPVCFVSAKTGAGVTDLLDIAEHLFPHPGEANPPLFVKGTGEDAEPLTTSPDPTAHVVADVFKIVNDPFVGKLGVFRVYQGTVRKDSQLFVDDGRKPFKVNHLFKLKGKEHIEVGQAVPGDIAAVAKVDELHFDAILHDSHDEDHIHLAPLSFPMPMFGLAVEVAAKGQEQKLATGLARLAEEDPACRVEHNAETHETVIRGLSDLHLRLLLQRLQQRFGVEVKTHPPRIAYRETVGATAEGHCRHKKQTGGAGQFGEVFLRIEPLPRGTGFEFVDQVRGGTIPGQYLPAVEKGVRQVLGAGAIAGFPMQDIRVVVYDGKHHPVDSKEIAFIAAGKKAFLDAVQKARPQVLEPIVDLEVTVPEAHMGDISGGLSTRRARINGSETVGRGEIAVRAQTPMSELEGYAAELNSVTGGRGRYSLEFSHYEPVPDAVQQKLVGAFRPHADDD